jgi:ATP-dependent Clp protease adaptor protein ClpS
MKQASSFPVPFRIAPASAGPGSGTQPAVIKPKEITEVTPRLTPMYKVLIHNDDVTPMDFVVYVLMEVFKKTVQDAADIMVTAHHGGVALVTVLPLEQAELRADQAHSLARAQKYPLTFTYEPD